LTYKHWLISIGSIFFSIILLAVAGKQVRFPETYSNALFDRQHKLLSAAIADDEQWRFAPLDSLPKKYIHSVIMAEDRRFYSHHGVDPLAIIRSAWINITRNEIVSGASTITMQVIRLARQNQPRTFGEKILEMILATGLELDYGKDEILGFYAAHAPFGGNVVGLEAAAWRYFGRDPDQLSWGENATLAVLPNAPALIHPGRNREKLKQKRNQLLLKLHQSGLIDSLTYSMACYEDLPNVPYALPQDAPHLLQRIKKEKNEYGRFYCTIDGSTQEMVDDVLGRHHSRLKANHIYDAAVLIIDNQASEVMAYVGNITEDRMREQGRYVDLIISPRSTGSILKPILYAALIENGELLPTQLVEDVPFRLGGFAPQNYSRSYNGAVPAARALARSLNVPAVHLLQQYGVNRFHFKLKQLGMTTLFRPADQYGLSLILGGAEGTLWEICNIYAGFARSLNSFFGRPLYGGAPDYLVKPAEDNNGVTYYHFDPGTAWLTLDALLEVSRPDLEQFWENFSSSRPVAWKTGTSYGHRDAWAIGVTPEYTVGVWVGNADGEGRPGLTGLQAAAPILFDIFYLLPPTSWFDTPESALQEISVCSSSGYRPGPFCAGLKKTLIPINSEAGSTCPFCRRVHLNPTLTYRVSQSCEPAVSMHVLKWFVLPPAIEMYYIKKHPEYIPLPPVHADCPEEEQSQFSLIHPATGGIILVPLELTGEWGKTVLKAAHRRRDATLFWHMDNVYLGRTSERHEMAVSPPPGEHILTVIDDQGNILKQHIRIISAHHSY